MPKKLVRVTKAPARKQAKAKSATTKKGVSTKNAKGDVKIRKVRAGQNSLGTKNDGFGKQAARQIVAYRKSISNHERAGRHAEYEAFQEVVRVGRELAKSELAWTEFISRPYWNVFKKKRPKDSDRGKAVDFAIRLFKGPGEEASKLASLRRRALKFLETFVPDDGIAEWLKKEGGYYEAIECARVLHDESHVDSLRKKKARAAKALSASASDATSEPLSTKTPPPTKTKLNPNQTELVVTLRLDPELNRIFTFQDGQMGKMTFTVIHMGKNPILRVETCGLA